MPVKMRLFYLCTGWLAACLAYIATSFMTSYSWLIPESPIEQLIPFNPSGIWLYLLFYIYIPYTFITANASNIKALNSSFILTAGISGLIFFLVPSTIVYPDFEINGLSTYSLNVVKEYDTRQNCFPSLHASLITLCTIANWDRLKPLKSYGLILLSLLMYVAIIQVRRHLFIDVAGGIVLALLVWPLCVRLMKKV